PEQSWDEAEEPEVSVSEWILEDGGEAAETMTFSYVTDAYQPQRLANIAMRQRRAGGAISLPMNFSGYNCRPGRVVRVNLPSLNILGEFIVSDWSMGDNEGCTVQVKQYEAAIFDDAVGQPYNPLGFINLPNGGLGSPTGLAWAAGDVAEVVQGVLSWVPPQGIVASYVVTVRQGNNAVQSRSVPATANTLAINGLPSGAYTMSVAALGPMARSGEATISVSIQGPPIPESCVVQSSLDSIVLIPQNPNHALNGGTYEYFFSTNPKATSGTAEYLGQGLSFTHNGLAFYTNYYYFIRSSNAYGKSAFLYVPASTSNDISAYLAAFAGKITETELGQKVLEKIELVEQLQDLINALDGLKAYDSDQTYEKGQMVVDDDRIYQAERAVPKGTPPPNAAYWDDVGTLLETANGLAAQVQTHTTEINELNGVVTAQASNMQALRAAYREDDGEGALADALKGYNSAASIVQEQMTRATQNEAMARTVTQLSATVGANSAQVTDLREVVSTNQASTSTSLQQLSASVASANNASAQNAAAIQQTATAYADTAGKLTTMWSVKMQLTQDGRYVAAGIGLGIENTAAGLQSQFLVSADRFAIIGTMAGGGTYTPFVVQGGQVFVNQAFIQDASIGVAKLTQSLQSSNYIAGQQGLKINFVTGEFEFNSATGDGGRQTINNAGGKVYDENQTKRYQWGNLKA
ncbi:phage tail protein, partial [Pseudomonas syringae]|uniref:phage tail protein n=1 Tax=Pseudomonas syringae TaxID=317 RepID=UPI001F284D8C